MSGWKDLLREACAERTLGRARSAIGTGVVYKLGKGGFDPTKPLGGYADCSGFVAWAIGIPRELPPGSGRWLQTTTYWEGGGAAGEGLFDQVAASAGAPGDLIVYPDIGGSQGHIGLISETVGGRPAKVIHCSSGNYKRTGDAIRETTPDVFTVQSKTRIVRVDYRALRALFAIPEVGDAPAPGPAPQLAHPVLAADETWRRVVAGALVLEPTGGPVAGCAALQDALNALAAANPSYRVDVGPDGRHRGYYGPKTAAAVKSFQSDHGLPAAGELDAATALAIDGAWAALGAARGPAEPGVACALRWDGSRLYATVNGESEIYVGKRVSYGGGYGLANGGRTSPWRYDPAEYAADYGYWAQYLAPTALCESNGRFDCLNTYDRARFTFGFLQFAAHTPGENFVVLLRALLALPEAARYFPDLSLVSGRVARNVNGQTALLETAASTAPLMDYLNPSLAAVENAEAVNAAKLVHWSDNNPRHRQTQARVGIEKLRAVMPNYATRYGLNGRLDSVCVVVFDIRHQGRARSAEIVEALDTSGDDARALENLLQVGAHAYGQRLTTLRQAVETLTQQGILGVRRYCLADNAFR
jgi:hypothetical protein